MNWSIRQLLLTSSFFTYTVRRSAITFWCHVYLIQGYLLKRSSSSINKEWKKKYVTLLQGGVLAYYPNLHVSTYCICPWFIYRLTHSASELSGFTCTSSLTINEKFQYHMRPPSGVLKNFEFIVSERVQVNPDNSRAMSALTFLLFKLNTL